MRGDFKDHGCWNRGIARDLKFLASPTRCPTTSPIIKAYQAKVILKKQKKKDTASKKRKKA